LSGASYWNWYCWYADAIRDKFFTPMTLIFFLLLQLGDLATTAVFLSHGVAEANPLIAAAIRVSTHPAIPLLAVKAAGCGLAWIAWKSGRRKLLRRANLFFALCVAWNLAACVL